MNNKFQIIHSFENKYTESCLLEVFLNSTTDIRSSQKCSQPVVENVVNFPLAKCHVASATAAFQAYIQHFTQHKAIFCDFYFTSSNFIKDVIFNIGFTTNTEQIILRLVSIENRLSIQIFKAK